MCWIWHQKVREMVKSCIKWFTTRKPHTYFSASSTKYKCLKIWWLAKIIVTLKCQNQKFKNHNRYNHRGHSYWNFLYCGWFLQRIWSRDGKKLPSVHSWRPETVPEAHDVRRGGHHDSDMLPLQHLPQLQALLSVMRVRTVEASVPTPVLVQSFCGNHAALFRVADNVPPSCLFRRMHRHQFRWQYLHSCGTQ